MATAPEASGLRTLAVDLTPPSFVLPRGLGVPPPLEDKNVISGRALLGRAHQPGLQLSVDAELRALNGADSQSSPTSRPTPRLPGGAPHGPSVLLVGSGFAMQEAVVEAVEGQGVHCELSPADEIVEAVVVASPDLVVLTGDASTDAGASVLDVLRHSPIGSHVPVAVLCEQPTLEERLRAFRHGATALIHHSASACDTALAVTSLAESLADHGHPIACGSETALADLLRVLSAEVSRALGVHEPGAADDGVLLLMHTERDVSRLIDAFVTHLATRVTRTRTVEYELGEKNAAGPEALDRADIAGVRLVVADDHAARADAVAQELRSHGAVVVVADIDPSPERFELLKQFDPIAIVMGREHASGGGASLLRRLRADLRLRWATTRTLDWSELAPGADGRSRVLGTLASAADPEHHIRQQLAQDQSFDIRLESLGPARLLRVLSALPFATRLTLHNRRLRVSVDVSPSLIVGASGVVDESERTREVEGPDALAALLVVSSGRAHLERVARPLAVNLMSPTDLALGQADADDAPIVPSSRLAEVAVSVATASVPDVEERAPASDVPHTGASAGAGSERAIELPSPRRRSSKRRAPTVALALGVAALVVGIIVVDSRRNESARRGTPIAAAAPRASGEVGLPSLTERAERGEPEALAVLDARPPAERSMEQLLALSRGKVARKQNELARLGQAIAQEPVLGASPEVLRHLRRDADHPEVHAEALRVIASLPGATAGDVLYDVWVKTTQRTPATELAARLVYTAPVLERASPALRVALELRTLDKCEQLLPLLGRVREQGDRRSTLLVARLAERGAACPKNAGDCQPCPRGTVELRRAITAAADRAAPSFE